MSVFHSSSAMALALSVICLQSSAFAGDPKLGAARIKSDPAVSIRRAMLKITASASLVRELEVRPSGPGDFGQPYRYEYAGEVIVTVHENLKAVSLGVSSRVSQLFVSGLPRSWRSNSVDLKPGTYRYPFSFKSYSAVTGFTVQMTTTPDFVRQTEIASADFIVRTPRPH